MTSEIRRVKVLPPSDVRTHKQRWKWVRNDAYRYRDVAWTETVKSRLKSWDQMHAYWIKQHNAITSIEESKRPGIIQKPTSELSHHLSVVRAYDEMAEVRAGETQEQKEQRHAKLKALIEQSEFKSIEAPIISFLDVKVDKVERNDYYEYCNMIELMEDTK